MARQFPWRRLLLCDGFLRIQLINEAIFYEGLFKYNTSNTFQQYVFILAICLIYKTKQQRGIHDW